MNRSTRVTTICSYLRATAGVAFLALFPCASASEYHGQVLFGGIAVPGATVTVTQGSQKLSTVTDTQGFYQFPDLPDGGWSLRIEMLGFAAVDRTITISSSTPQGAWNLDLLPLETMLAQSRVEASQPQALQVRPRWRCRPRLSQRRKTRPTNLRRRCVRLMRATKALMACL